MTRVERAAKPAVIEQNQVAWTQALLDAATKEDKKRAEKKYRHLEIKRALVSMFHGKCAYCESKILHVDYGHIEHFRPKSKPEFRSLAFEWRNLLLSCAVCNGPEHKGDRFPEADEGGPLINPCEDFPEEHFEFAFDFQARLASVVGTTARGKTTATLLGLNRQDLRAYRSRRVMQLCVLSRCAENDPDARALLEEACHDDAEYAAFARTLVVGHICDQGLQENDR
ncbi:MAG: retron system putative HNH endonuclease [Pseudomonadota bacterium]|nr:retron system putative HNH endonuclease [Pseudomonadota bacterium]